MGLSERECNCGCKYGCGIFMYIYCQSCLNLDFAFRPERNAEKYLRYLFNDGECDDNSDDESKDSTDDMSNQGAFEDNSIGKLENSMNTSLRE